MTNSVLQLNKAEGVRGFHHYFLFFISVFGFSHEVPPTTPMQLKPVQAIQTFKNSQISRNGGNISEQWSQGLNIRTTGLNSALDKPLLFSPVFVEALRRADSPSSKSYRKSEEFFVPGLIPKPEINRGV